MRSESWRNCCIAIGALLLVQGAVLYYFGQPMLCTCGYVKFWEGVVQSLGNSQHLTDWYTFSHIIHGFIFYLVFWALFPRLPVSTRLMLALGLEVAWEITENTPWIINLYRQQALASGYSGDSIINSLSDTLMMALGYVLAWRMPVWSVISAALLMELVVGYFIHDNLTLNVLNLIHQFDFIRAWQSAVS